MKLIHLKDLWCLLFLLSFLATSFFLSFQSFFFTAWFVSKLEAWPHSCVRAAPLILITSACLCLALVLRDTGSLPAWDLTASLCRAWVTTQEGLTAPTLVTLTSLNMLGRQASFVDSYQYIWRIVYLTVGHMKTKEKAIYSRCYFFSPF